MKSGRGRRPDERRLSRAGRRAGARTPRHRRRPLLEPLGPHRRCLDSLRTHTDLDRAEVLVVDNGSTDETPEALSDYPWVRTLRNPSNLGFVRGNNAGLSAVPFGSDVVLLNNDVLVEQHDWLERLQECALSAPDSQYGTSMQLSGMGNVNPNAFGSPGFAIH